MPTRTPRTRPPAGRRSDGCVWHDGAHGQPAPVARGSPDRVRSKRFRRPSSRRRRAAGDSHLVGARRPPSRPDERRQPQSVRVHHRGSRRAGRRRPGTARRGRDQRDRHGRALGRASPDRRRRRDPVRAARRHDDGRGGRAGAGVRCPDRRPLRPAGLPLRPGRHARRPDQAGRRPARPVRGAQGGDRPQRARAGPRAGSDAPLGRRGGRRCPAVPDRLQHQPRERRRRAREADRPAGP